MYAVNEDKSKATLSEPETTTINLNNNCKIDLQKIGAMVFFHFYSTQGVGAYRTALGRLPEGYRPISDTAFAMSEYGQGSGGDSSGVVLAGTGILRINATGILTMSIQNLDRQIRECCGSFIADV